MEILAYCIPSLVVLAAVWIVMHKLYANEQEKRLWELKKASQKEITPTRLRAYERLTLLLERTQPEHMIMEINVVDYTTIQLQQHLLRTIRQEFDHNLSQQVYVSDELWQKILLARDEMAAFITTIAAQMAPDSTALDYAKAMMTAYAQNGATPHEIALTALKEEAKNLF